MISIIVPFFNTEEYLEECLASIRGQTFSDYECLMVDDGSTDSSREIASKFLEDLRFKLLNKEHVGFPQAKNIGLDNAQGDYICFVDSDDFVNEHYLEDLYNILIETNTDISCCGHYGFREDPNPHHVRSHYVEIYKEDRMHKVFGECSTFMWNKLYKKEIFDNIRFDNVEALSDTMLCYKLFEKANSVSYVSDILIYHRIHDENMTYKVRHFSPTYWEHRLNVYLTMCSHLCECYPQFDKTYKSIFRSECEFIKPHLTKEVYIRYLEKDDVKRLLS